MSMSLDLDATCLDTNLLDYFKGLEIELQLGIFHYNADTGIIEAYC